MFLDHESLKLEPKERRLTGTVNMYDVDCRITTRSPTTSHVVWTHLGSGGVGVGSCSMDPTGGR
jgi:hypothetical protein